MDRGYFEDLMSVFEENPDWELDFYWVEDSSAGAKEGLAEDLIEHAAESDREEFSYRHDKTGAVLHLFTPDFSEEEPKALTGSMDKFFDRIEEYGKGSELVSRIGEAHEKLAEKHLGDNDYFSASSSFNDFVSISVPIDYSREELEKGLRNMSDLAEEVDEYHNQVLEVAQYDE